MKFTLSWLKDHLDTDADLEKIVDTLTRIGLEVESVTNDADRLKAFATAKVVKAEQHPNADRLRVCHSGWYEGEHLDSSRPVLDLDFGVPDPGDRDQFQAYG